MLQIGKIKVAKSDFEKLSLVDKSRLEKVFARLIELDIRFPVAEIASKLKANKGNVSAYLKGKKAISDNFYTTFFEKFPASDHIDNILNEETTDYITNRRNLKNHKTNNTLMYYEIGARAGTATNAEVLPVNKNEGVLHISDLFKGSEYAIRISGNSMMPNYPPGAIIGIREIPDKQITPGSVYVVEKENDLWIKRLFYKDNDQETGVFVCASDSTLQYENGPMKGEYYYPKFTIPVDKVRRLFKVTGTYKSNELTVINH